MMDICVALIHWPIKDRKGDIVVTNVTNFDIHDIARACRSYGVKNYYIVNPLKDQQMFVERILDHWRVGYGQKFNPMRKTALVDVKPAANLEEVIADWGAPVYVVATAARTLDELAESDKTLAHLEQHSFPSLREKIQKGKPSEKLLIVFGTGFGLHHEVIAQGQALLEPIWGAAPDKYRHLSVRSAVSIVLDRLLGDRS